MRKIGICKNMKNPPALQQRGGEKIEKRLTFFQLAKKYGYLFFYLLFILWATPRGSSSTPGGSSALESDSMLSAGNY